MRRFLATTAIAGMTLALTLLGGPASAAPDTVAADGFPCDSEVIQPQGMPRAQFCPDWAPDGSIPVHEDLSQGSPVVGQINPSGGDWYVCQLSGGTYRLGELENNWWAITMADNGEIGAVNQVYFRGGENNEPDAGLARCENISL